MYFYELSDDIDAQVDNATIVHLLQLWHRLRAHADGDLPRFDDLAPARLDWCAADLMVLEPAGDGDFRYLHYGANIAAASGFDMTGRLTSEFRSEVGRFFREKYLQCLADARPLYTVHRGSHAPTVHTWERLLLPVRAGQAPRLVVFNRPMAMRHEFLQSVLESTGIGVVYLAAVRDAASNAPDFHVVSVNRAAAEMLLSDVHRMSDRRAREAFADPFADRVIGLAAAVYADGAPASVEVHGMHNGAHRHLQVSAAKAGDGVTIAISDITPYREQERALRVLNQRLEDEVAVRRDLERELRRRMDVDPLTGVLARRAFLERLDAEVARAQRHDRSLGVLMLDLDRFKAVNDAHGHAQGDRVLERAATACGGILRRGDFVGRLGGDEFAVCLTEAGREAPGEVAERARAAVAAAFADESMLSLRVTASVGAALLGAGESAQAVLARADRALYRAKVDGRDRVAVDAAPGEAG